MLSFLVSICKHEKQIDDINFLWRYINSPTSTFTAATPHSHHHYPSLLGNWMLLYKSLRTLSILGYYCLLTEYLLCVNREIIPRWNENNWSLDESWPLLLLLLLLLLFNKGFGKRASLLLLLFCFVLAIRKHDLDYLNKYFNYAISRKKYISEEGWRWFSRERLWKSLPKTPTPTFFWNMSFSWYNIKNILNIETDSCRNIRICTQNYILFSYHNPKKESLSHLNFSLQIMVYIQTIVLGFFFLFAGFIFLILFEKRDRKFDRNLFRFQLYRIHIFLVLK